MNEAWVAIHIEHDYAPETTIYPHIHWSTTGTNTGTCRWGLDYMVSKGHGQEAFPAQTTVYVEQAAGGTAYTHYIAEVADGDVIPVTSLEVDSLVMMRVFRDGAHGNDTLTDAAYGLFVDLHYLADRRGGTINKAPNFYKP
jgi:hypothetical protein